MSSRKRKLGLGLAKVDTYAPRFNPLNRRRLGGGAKVSSRTGGKQTQPSTIAPKGVSGAERSTRGAAVSGSARLSAPLPLTTAGSSFKKVVKRLGGTFYRMTGLSTVMKALRGKK